MLMNDSFFFEKKNNLILNVEEELEYEKITFLVIEGIERGIVP